MLKLWYLLDADVSEKRVRMLQDVEKGAALGWWGRRGEGRPGMWRGRRRRPTSRRGVRRGTHSFLNCLQSLNMPQHASLLIMNSYPVARSSLLALVRSLSHFVTRSSRKDLLIHTSSNSVTYKHIQSGHRPERAGPRHHSHNYSDIPRPRGLGSNRKNWR